MAKNPFAQSEAAGHQRVANIDGHGVNHHYKNPSATGKENLSYLHPHSHGGMLNMQEPFQSVDRALEEAGRPSNQVGRSKTVFPVSTDKQRGQPKVPGASRSQSHAPGVVQAPPKPSTF